MYYARHADETIRKLSKMFGAVLVTATASCTGQLLNLASLARDVGVSQPTAERWLSILVTSNQVYLLRPYHNNIAKRTVKTPKLYFLDTGLAAYLTRWTTADVLKNGAMAGAFFETFVIAEIMKSYSNQGILDLPLYFYRDRDGNEIDLLIEDGGVLYPIEINKHADPVKSDVAKFSILDKLPNVRRGPGGVVCLYDRLATLQGEDRAIPVSML